MCESFVTFSQHQLILHGGRWETLGHVQATPGGGFAPMFYRYVKMTERMSVTALRKFYSFSFNLYLCFYDISLHTGPVYMAVRLESFGEAD